MAVTVNFATFMPYHELLVQTSKTTPLRAARSAPTINGAARPSQCVRANFGDDHTVTITTPRAQIGWNVARISASRLVAHA